MMRTSLALAVAGAALVAPAMGLAATAADKAAAMRASAWLAGEAPSGLPAGQQADVMVTMRLTGTPAPALRARMRAMAAAAPAYADTAGATAKVVLGAVAAGGNPSALGGVDYLARLSAQSTGAGRYGRNAFDQGLAMIALRAATGKVPAAAVTTLLGAKSGPGWNLELSATGAPGVDSTALAVVALRAGGQSCTSAPIREARAWLAAQRANGGWTAYRDHRPARTPRRSWRAPTSHAGPRHVEPSICCGHCSSDRAPSASRAPSPRADCSQPASPWRPSPACRWRGACGPDERGCPYRGSVAVPRKEMASFFPVFECFALNCSGSERIPA
jgi:hypothetical protein